ncbi:MAG: hypothetical protein WED04_07330 [Promethearchaeati archaeon SRVP18_Atabeyarchaeia-1]
MQYYPGLFEWWVISISSSIVFMTAVAIFLYSNTRSRRREAASATGKKASLGGNFIFVWVLLGLLLLYVVSINLGSYLLFAFGNVVVELALIAYLAKNRLG